MRAIRNVKLELLRPGPAHNQLLSPLTQYLALCGADGPVTVQLPFEHRQLLTRLKRLRYDSGRSAAVDDQRQAEVRDMGEVLGRVLGQVPALLSELSNARAEGGKLVHLRLSLSAFELGMVPFEAAIAPDGFPGSGSPMFLQTRTPITITREIRLGRSLPMEWNRKPRILFAFASPGGRARVPAQAHLEAIRRAIEPWVRIKDSPADRIECVKSLLTVMPDASLETIRRACSRTEYTHVHILAHGEPDESMGDRRFGLALCSDADDSMRADIVDGERLAIALTASDSSGNAKFRPTLVTLATCDSGNINSVLTPGGSIAHELHASGIPWVIASQFPLWMRASSIAAEVLYTGLLRGDDPRWVLYELRQRLRTDSPGTHDWASIVAYATLPIEFERQVEAFRDKQIRRRIEVKFDRIDELTSIDAGGNVARGAAARDAELKSLYSSIRSELKAWREEPITAVSAKEKAERLGMSAAGEKRIGIACLLAAKGDASDSKTFRENQEECRRACESSRDFYRAALEAEPHNHWVITQYLSMAATPILTDGTPALRALEQEYGRWWIAAKQIAEWRLSGAFGVDRAWALSTLAELAMLGVIYGGKGFDKTRAHEDVTRFCEQMRELEAIDAFPISATRRQFGRYVEYWERKEWFDLARAAMKALRGGEPAEASGSTAA